MGGNLDRRPLSDDALTDIGDRYVTWSVGSGHGREVFEHGGATVVVIRRPDRVGVLAIGDDRAIPSLVAAVISTIAPELARDGVGEVRLSVPPRSYEGLPARLRTPTASAWTWMWTTLDPPEGPLPIRWLDPAQSAGLTALLRHSPRAHARPGDPSVAGWAGGFVGQVPTSAGALTISDAGVPHLRAIVTHPDWRGQGWGASVTSFLTTAGLQREEVVTLGLYADNDTAHRLYRRLGYVDSHSWVSDTITLSTA